MRFEWDENKNIQNIDKHGVSFEEAQKVFMDRNLKLRYDEKHSSKGEKRYFGYGKIGENILTVRFTLRRNAIRIIGAGYWREGRDYYG
ncbi:MAG: BrnT family toxin [bacterium]